MKYSIVNDDRNGSINDIKKSKTNIIDNINQLESELLLKNYMEYKL